MDFITKYFILVKADLHRSLVFVVVQVFVQVMTSITHVKTIIIVFREEDFHCRKEGLSCQSLAVFRDQQFCCWTDVVDRVYFGQIIAAFVISGAFCDLKQRFFQIRNSLIKFIL